MDPDLAWQVPTASKTWQWEQIFFTVYLAANRSGFAATLKGRWAKRSPKFPTTSGKRGSSHITSGRTYFPQPKTSTWFPFKQRGEIAPSSVGHFKVFMCLCKGTYIHLHFSGLCCECVFVYASVCAYVWERKVREHWKSAPHVQHMSSGCDWHTCRIYICGRSSMASGRAEIHKIDVSIDHTHTHDIERCTRDRCGQIELKYEHLSERFSVTRYNKDEKQFPNEIRGLLLATWHLL